VSLCQCQSAGHNRKGTRGHFHGEQLGETYGPCNYEAIRTVTVDWGPNGPEPQIEELRLCDACAAYHEAKAGGNKMADAPVATSSASARRSIIEDAEVPLKLVQFGVRAALAIQAVVDRILALDEIDDWDEGILEIIFEKCPDVLAHDYDEDGFCRDCGADEQEPEGSRPCFKRHRKR
jgi:hypothetical protein